MRPANLVLLLTSIVCSVPAALADIAPEPNFEPTSPQVAILGAVISVTAIGVGLLISKKMKQRATAKQLRNSEKTIAR
ncbi:MAG TPA: hypothetical protein V6C81_21145 [Planktothrix sp.]|jgi:hypothetical protein